MKRYVVLAMFLFLVISTFGCTRSADQLPQAEDTTTAGDATQAAPGSDAHMAAAKLSGDSVTPQAASGNVQVVPVESKFPCKDRNECTSTKYSNSPKKDAECACAAACTPYVVSKAEAQRREAANKRLCNTSDWYGDQCPAPECSFMEFESFKCVGGKCVGMALGK